MAGARMSACFSEGVPPGKKKPSGCERVALERAGEEGILQRSCGDHVPVSEDSLEVRSLGGWQPQQGLEGRKDSETLMGRLGISRGKREVR